jgi:two-component system response regulator FixJ
MSEPKTVHLVDDDENIRRSVGFMLKTSGYAVTPWPNGTSFLKEVDNETTGCVLLDIRMPDIDGLEVQAILNQRGIRMPVIVITGHGETTLAVRAMKAGAHDFIEKPFDREALLDTVQTAFDRVADQQKVSEHAEEAKIRINALSEREQEVLKGMADGLPNKVIAHRLGISPRTVEAHRAHVMAKLDVTNFADALRLAFAAGLRTVDDA